MKLIATLIIFTSIICPAQNISEYNTHYRGENIYLQNPFKGDGLGFCVDSVLINDLKVKDPINSSAFMVNLGNLNLQLDDSINIKIYHGNDCFPKILNTNLGSQSPTVDFIDISFDSKGVLKWTTKNEKKNQPFIIEQYRWNKWIRVGEVDGKGMLLHNEYSFKPNFHQGLNLFRVKQYNPYGKTKISATVEIETEIVDLYWTKRVNDNKKIEFKIKNKNEIYTSFETLYELFDTHGNLVLKGFGSFIGCSDLKKGLYYLNFDGKSGEVISIP